VVLAPLSRSIYLTADGEIVWLGPRDSLLHARAMLTADDAVDPSRRRPAAGDHLPIDPRDAAVWNAATPSLTPAEALRLADGLRSLAGSLAAVREPDGFGRWLAGRELQPLLAPVTARIEALAAAVDQDDAVAVTSAAVGLLGLGPGLTPAGDDLVGGVFFGRRLRAGVPAPGDAWRAAATTLRAAAVEATHPISAALLGDLLDGHGHAPLHDLVRALVAGEGDRARAAAGRLVHIGHSSGWDMLTGLAIGVLGLHARGQ
jgi:hypothetical protein